MPYKAMKDSHPARKTFQAIRIEVNNELGVLRDALEEAIEMLNVGGRISVITFHSLEDKIVKEIFNKYSKVDSSLSKLPFIPKEYLPKFKLIANITPSKEELEENNRARSSRLRVIERIEDWFYEKEEKKGFTKVERFLYKSSLVIIVFLVVGIVFTSTAVSKMNIELQDMNKKVEKALDTNESLAMKINEMASLDNIQSISRNLGLAYKNENIKTIE